MMVQLARKTNSSHVTPVCSTHILSLTKGIENECKLVNQSYFPLHLDLPRKLLHALIGITVLHVL